MTLDKNSAVWCMSLAMFKTALPKCLAYNFTLEAAGCREQTINEL